MSTVNSFMFKTHTRPNCRKNKTICGDIEVIGINKMEMSSYCWVINHIIPIFVSISSKLPTIYYDCICFENVYLFPEFSEWIVHKEQ